MNAMKPNPCKCGSKLPRVQDHGDFAFVKCPDCGDKTGFVHAYETLEYLAEALSLWNTSHPIDTERPSKLTLKYSEFLPWMLNHKGKVDVLAMEVVGYGYRLSLHWRNDLTQPLLLK